MKTRPVERGATAAAPILELARVGEAEPPGTTLPSQVQRARAFAEPLLAGQPFDTGEDALVHADGVVELLAGIGADDTLRSAAYLVYAGDYLNKPEDIVAKAFGTDHARLVTHTRRLVKVQRSARDALGDDFDGPIQAEQLERVRKMLLAFSQDLRVVLLRLASRLQTLRFYARTHKTCPKVLAQESLQVFAPLANRLGIWQIKWEMEDLAFRFLQPEPYQRVASLLDEKRVEREAAVEAARSAVAAALTAEGIRAEVLGRPKHIYSIWKKMQGKGLSIDRIYDLHALRVIVGSVDDCYGALARVHTLMTPVPSEFDDYIARPKPNGYQSLHTVVRDAQGRHVEIQIRTREMHEHAESGVAAHWAYKEAGSKGYAGVVAEGDFEARVAEARKAVLRQLLAWERDLATDATEAEHKPQGYFDDRIFVFTPQGTIIELTAGSTPVDFAYAVHTDLGHRCRGAKVDGVMVPLNTALASGQTVEVVAIRDGGAPSMDWLNPELAYLRSPRAKAKVRAWFNAVAQRDTIARGREAVERLLQREGRTSIKLEDLAEKLGFRSADALFEVVGKDEFSLRQIETLLRPPEAEADPDAQLARKLNRGDAGAPSRSNVLVVGVDSLMTQLARCCKPAPPDAIEGFVTRGKGVAVHRADCSNFRQMAGRSPERLIPVTWGRALAEGNSYAVDVSVEAIDRPGLLRDLSEVFAKEKMHVSGVESQTQRHAHGNFARMRFTVQIRDAVALETALIRVRQVAGVQTARRR